VLKKGNSPSKTAPQSGIIKEKREAITMRAGQMQMVSVEQIMPENHNYRRLKKLLNFTSIVREAKVRDTQLGAFGFGRERLILCLILQFMEDTSDREF
jgi:xanthine dehydrogenase molybdopterin-binding subunit B